jgi:hypothetical protein
MQARDFDADRQNPGLKQEIQAMIHQLGRDDCGLDQVCTVGEL